MWLKGIVLLLSYLLGCFNTGYYYIRAIYKEDVRTVGTKVTGAYNVSRVAGKRGFLITFLGDALKGGLAVLLCRLLDMNDTIILLAILSVIAGHILPIQLKFRGGKGLSTAFGAFLAYHPLWILFWILTCVILLPLVRRYTITCLFALMLLPLELFIADYSMNMILFVVIYALLILYACKDNMKEYIQSQAYQGGKNGGHS